MLKDRILTLTQMLKQVKQEEEQLLKKIHSTSCVTPRSRSIDSSQVIRQHYQNQHQYQLLRDRSSSSMRAYQQQQDSSRRQFQNEGDSTSINLADEDQSSSIINVDTVAPSKTRQKKLTAPQKQ